MNFKSDNITRIHPKIMQGILDANLGTQPSYGNDFYSQELTKNFGSIFETQVSVYLTSTGTAANSLGLSALVAPFEAIFCHKEAHIQTDEANAPEFFTGGAKLIAVDGENGKMNPDALVSAIETCLSLRPHCAKPGCISITQTTECGTVYSLDELDVIRKIGAKYELPIHMDGARFAGSLVHLGCSPAQATWKMGVDVMSFGATKNGAMAAESIIFFNQKYAQNFDYAHKRGGQLMSKMRFFSSQFLAYFKDDLWLENALYANNMALKLAQIFINFNFELKYPVQSNEVFVNLPLTVASFLQEKGAGFYEWAFPGSGLYRFVTSCLTEDVELNEMQKVLSEIT